MGPKIKLKSLHYTYVLTVVGIRYQVYRFPLLSKRKYVHATPGITELQNSCSTIICIRMFVKFSYFCQLFSWYKELFGKTPNVRTHEARPDTLVEVSARSVHSGARGRLLKCLPSGEDETISPVSIREALFCTYVPLNCRHFFGPVFCA